MKQPGVTGVLLAAGRARRFGGNKIAARLADGRALGVVAANTLRAAVDRVLVVIAPDNAETAALFAAAGFDTVVAPDAALGMGHSLATGIARTSDSDAWLVALADMPFVMPSTLAALVGALRGGAAIVVPRYQGRNGHPVGFSARFGAELSALSGDRGARELLARHREEVIYLDVEDSGVVSDIDTPADLPG